MKFVNKISPDGAAQWIVASVSVVIGYMAIVNRRNSVFAERALSNASVRENTISLVSQ